MRSIYLTGFSGGAPLNLVPLGLAVAAPSTSGIYVATLRSNELVPVTQDTRYVEICARVNCSNVKVGKARNFSLREKVYWKDFGADNVSFVAIAITHDIQAAETAVLRRLKCFRKRTPNGRMMDWLENITVDEAIAAVHEALTDAGIPYERALS